MFETETKTFLSYAVEKTHGRYTEETIFRQLRNHRKSLLGTVCIELKTSCRLLELSPYYRPGVRDS
jgi:rRNA-processing protein FCF1